MSKEIYKYMEEDIDPVYKKRVIVDQDCTYVPAGMEEKRTSAEDKRGTPISKKFQHTGKKFKPKGR